MVVDTVIQNWGYLVVGKEAVPEGFSWAVQWIMSFFYVDGVILTSPRLARLQAALDVLTGLFDWVVLWMNIIKNWGWSTNSSKWWTGTWRLIQAAYDRGVPIV